MPRVKRQAVDRLRNSPMCEGNAKQKIIPLMAFGTLLLGLSTLQLLPIKLVWNASESVPIGLYYITNSHPSRGDLVLSHLPKWARIIADDRHYLPSNTPVLKRISALAGDRVCQFGRSTFVNKIEVATAHFADDQLRKMPHWGRCQPLVEKFPENTP